MMARLSTVYNKGSQIAGIFWELKVSNSERLDARRLGRVGS